jgi:hypothetical protein
MTQPVISPAYQQELDWYRHFLAVQGVKPVPLLASENDPPGDLVNQPTETSTSTPMVDINV